MTDKLERYNRACFFLEERRLKNLSDRNVTRRTFDELYSSTMDYCLAQGLWRFCKRIQQIDNDTNITPAFGWSYGFTVPDDWVRTIVVSTAPRLDPPLMQYVEAGGKLFADTTPLYLSYVSKAANYGHDLGTWPPAFSEYFSARLAYNAAGKITGKDVLKKELEDRQMKERRVARGVDAMNDPPGLPPVPQLVLSRRGNFGRGIGGFGGGGENG